MMTTHESKRMQTVAMWWHVGFCILNIGALLYHAIAVKEHAQEIRKSS